MPRLHNVCMARTRALNRTFIREWREFRGMSLEEVGALVGKDHSTLSKIERGKSPYSQDLLEALAEILDTDVASLLIRDPNVPVAGEDVAALWSDIPEDARQALWGLLQLHASRNRPS